MNKIEMLYVHKHSHITAAEQRGRNRNKFTSTHGWADTFLPEMQLLATDLFG